MPNNDRTRALPNSLLVTLDYATRLLTDVRELGQQLERQLERDEEMGR